MRCNSYRLQFDGRMLSDGYIARLHTREHELGDFFLTEGHYPPNMRVPSHSHENASLYLILSGGMIENFGASSRERRHSTLVFNPAGEFHSNQILDEGCRLFMIELKSPWLESLGDCLRLPDLTTQCDSNLAVGLAQRAYSEICQQDSLSPLVIEGLVLELIAEITRAQRRTEHTRPIWLEKVRAILNECFGAQISTSELAREVGVHPVYLLSAFRRHYACSIREYIQRLRINYCCAQLRSSQATLTQIGLEAGFFDQSHFSRTFKRLIGTTPAAYRAATSSFTEYKTFRTYKTKRAEK